MPGENGEKKKVMMVFELRTAFSGCSQKAQFWGFGLKAKTPRFGHWEREKNYKKLKCKTLVLDL